MAIVLHTTPADLLAVRFAISPLWETQAAVRALVEPNPAPVHAPWRAASGRRAAALDLVLLAALHPPDGYVPDFASPPPSRVDATIDEELADLRATPLERVAAELARSRDSHRDPSPRRLLDGLVADPATARERLAAELARAWELLVGPVWPRLWELVDADVSHRARGLTRSGLGPVVDGLHPRVRWAEGAVVVDGGADEERWLGGEGLVLMPSAFIWPHAVAIVDPPWQPTVVYPARGVAELWQPYATTAPAALARLLGGSRARVLAALDEPASTTALARRLGLAAGGVSGHLATLRDAGLVVPRRHGREVRYRRTRLGDALLAGR